MTKHGVGKDANLVGTWDRCHHSNIFLCNSFALKKKQLNQALSQQHQRASTSNTS